MLATSSLRPARAFSIRFKPAALVVPCCANASFTTSARPAKIQRTAHPFSTSKSSPSPFQIVTRHASTAPASSASSPTPTPANTAATPQQLTWNDFLALRRTRRKISVVASSVSAIATTYTGLRVFIDQGMDSTLAMSFGLDPLMVTGFSAMAMMAVGWLIGPFFGNAVFNVRYRAIRADLESKEREFYNRIKKHRVDPTSSSMANPVPDYYGEKIGSVAGYRRWLKDQRAFNLKRGAYQGGK
ncbi:Pam17-domain-containing protein [Pleomassaria siparia CBS 279.74]|uniref:Presequence translocated-associated motor subunit PAM17 n=1 Tax=Pleomassaria siparia CBS 279.74 TaxID=1314801 RepID=A0A6G1KCY2_9PLEO|nr:Pam17-domain-containing protein [Pleomassaria siparia CBS 279.74]